MCATEPTRPPKSHRQRRLIGSLFPRRMAGWPYSSAIWPSRFGALTGRMANLPPLHYKDAQIKKQLAGAMEWHRRRRGGVDDVAEWLNSLPAHDGQPRVEHFLMDHFEAADTPLNLLGLSCAFCADCPPHTQRGLSLAWDSYIDWPAIHWQIGLGAAFVARAFAALCGAGAQFSESIGSYGAAVFGLCCR